jgi:predicted AlkP superfamily pyrophosphatase or phosphodiesterase
MTTLHISGTNAGAQVSVEAMARIVADLLGEGSIRLRDASWLREQAHYAGLDEHEYGSLESLRERLQLDRGGFWHRGDDPAIW